MESVFFFFNLFPPGPKSAKCALIIFVQIKNPISAGIYSSIVSYVMFYEKLTNICIIKIMQSFWLKRWFLQTK